MMAHAQKLPPVAPCARFTLVGWGMRPEAVTEMLKIEPAHTEIGVVRHCETGRKEECGSWSWDSSQVTSSKDLRDHLEQMIALFGPLKSRIEEIRPSPNIFVHVRPESNGVTTYRATRIDAGLVASIAELGASITFESLNA